MTLLRIASRRIAAVAQPRCSNSICKTQLATSLKTVAPKAAFSTLLPSMTSAFVNHKEPPVLTAKRAISSPTAKDMSDKEVNDIFQLWNNALATLDPDTVAKRYAKDSILLPTVSDTPRMDYDSIKAYFVDFLQKKPQGVLLESKVIKGDDWALDAGIYEFTMGATGDVVKARYTYLYTFEEGEWKISHHHSSIMPEAFL